MAEVQNGEGNSSISLRQRVFSTVSVYSFFVPWRTHLPGPADTLEGPYSFQAFWKWLILCLPISVAIFSRLYPALREE